VGHHLLITQVEEIYLAAGTEKGFARAFHIHVPITQSLFFVKSFGIFTQIYDKQFS